MSIKKRNLAFSPLLPSKKNKSSLFIKPFKKVAVDIEILFLVNTFVMYLILFLVKDTTVGMMNLLCVSIIAWRGGLFAGVLASIVMTISFTLCMHIPPNDNLPLLYYFNNKMPGWVFGLGQSLIIGSIVGYIASLVHSLKKEIVLREKIQKDLESKIAELDIFGHTVAHDLKNPLMVINLSIGALTEELSEIATVKAKKQLAYINNGTKQMIGIVESILLLAGIKKLANSEMSSFDMSEPVDDALLRQEYLLEAYGVIIKKPDRWPFVLGYAPWITEVWVNYINNAIKYGGSENNKIKPIIELGYDKNSISQNGAAEQIRFWVKDNGPGIEKEKIGTLFKEFTRLHSKNQEGHGLGLSIVKTVIDKLGGELGVESDVGKGSCFYFTLPIQPQIIEPKLASPHE